MFLMNKRQLVGSVVVFGILGKDIFHGAQIRDNVYKVEVKFILLLEAPLPFPNHNDDPPQLCF